MYANLVFLLFNYIVNLIIISLPDLQMLNVKGIFISFLIPDIELIVQMF